MLHRAPLTLLTLAMWALILGGLLIEIGILPKPPALAFFQPAPFQPAPNSRSLFIDRAPPFEQQTSFWVYAELAGAVAALVLFLILVTTFVVCGRASFAMFRPGVVRKWPWRAVARTICAALLIAGGSFAAYAYVQWETNDTRLTIATVVGGFGCLAISLAPMFVEGAALTPRDRIESTVLIGGFLLGIVTGAFLLGEYTDQKQARVARNWDLLAKVREEADRDLRNWLTYPALRARELNAGEICKGLELACDPNREFASLPMETRAATYDALLKRSRRSGRGQLDAIEALGRERVSFNGVDLRGFILDGMDARGRNMSGADFSGATIRSSDFQNADLSRAQFEGTDIDLSRWDGAIINDAIFSNMKIGGRIFSNVRGRRSQFKNVQVGGNLLDIVKTRMYDDDIFHKGNKIFIDNIIDNNKLIERYIEFMKSLHRYDEVYKILDIERYNAHELDNAKKYSFLNESINKLKCFDCIYNNTVMSYITFFEIDFYKSKHELVEWFNVLFDRAGMNLVHIINAKLREVSFIESNLEEVIFKNSQLVHVNFIKSRGVVRINESFVFGGNILSSQDIIFDITGSILVVKDKIPDKWGNICNDGGAYIVNYQGKFTVPINNCESFSYKINLDAIRLQINKKSEELLELIIKENSEK